MERLHFLQSIGALLTIAATHTPLKRKRVLSRGHVVAGVSNAGDRFALALNGKVAEHYAVAGETPEQVAAGMARAITKARFEVQGRLVSATALGPSVILNVDA